MRRSASFVALVLLAACKREPDAKGPIPVIDARPVPTAAPSAPVAPAAPVAQEKATASTTVYEPGNPLTMPTLEISGEVAVQPEASPPQRIYIYISKGDCLDAAAPLLRRMPVTETGAFMANVMTEPQTQLTLCASGDFGPDRPSTLYGKYGKPIVVGPQREQELREIKINLAISPAKQFPTPKK